MLAKLVAPLVATQIGREAAKRITAPLVDVGLRQRGLEVPPDIDVTPAGEALASTVEETIAETLALPTEALTD